MAMGRSKPVPAFRVSPGESDFAWSFVLPPDGAPREGYRATRTTEVSLAVTDRSRRTTILTGEYGAQVLEPLLPELNQVARSEVTVLPIANSFFGGNIAVTGLLTGRDVAGALASAPQPARYLLPDVVLSSGRFLDGLTVADLPRPVEVVATDGASLVDALR